MPSRFRVDAPFKPAGDQPEAIAQLVEGVQSGLSQQVLLGVTGSGKTNVMAWAVEQLQRPVLVLSTNKTLAAQLCAESRRLLPDNAVEYFVSYYDYYQPEAYIARTDTYIEKDSSRNDEIDRMRHSATSSLITRRDVLVVASISCIYGMGSVEDYMGEALKVEKGQSIRREVFLRKLTGMLYERNDYDLARFRFRVRGDVVDFVPANEEKVYRVEFFGDEIERIQELDAVTGEILGARNEFTVFPASHYVTPADKLRLAMVDIEAELEERCKWFEEHGRLLEAQRLRQRTNFDLEMLRETGTCAGIENYSLHLTRRQPGEAPYTLMDFLPDDTIIFVDESHVAVPQIGGMLGGDRSRKAALVEDGFKVRYLHSELDAMERIDVLRDLRTGAVDVVVGINLLREGLDLPEVAFIGILDADKEGYLRAYRSFIQIIGRAARNVDGHVVMYADQITDSMRQALDETERRRNRHIAYNAEPGITPETVNKAIYALEINEKDIQADAVELMVGAGVPREDLLAIARDLEKEMRRLSKELQFEDAARVRDRIIALRKRLAGEDLAKEDDSDVALAIAAAPKAKTMAGSHRFQRRGLRKV